jgi:hypothetical protein
VKNAELVLALVGTGLQAGLCLLLLLRRFYRQFPVFFASIGFFVVAALAQLGVSNYPQLYYHVYWFSEAVGVCLVFFTLQEAFRYIFRNFLGLRWFRWLFPGIGLLMLGVAVLRTLSLPSPAQSLSLTTIINLEIGVGFLQFGIFTLFILLIRIFHLRWRQHAVGIVFGFGIAAAGSLVVFILRSEFGTKFDPVVRITPAIAYLIGVAVWLATFIRKEPSQPKQSWDGELTPEQMITELRRHTKAVKGILGR